MNKKLVTITAVIALTAGYAVAEETDMSDPTEAATAVGFGYGNEGLNLKLSYMNSEPGAAQKSGFLLEINDVLNSEGGADKFKEMAYDATSNTVYPDMSDEVNNLNFRFRYGSVNTDNGLGAMVDIVLKDSPWYGHFAVAQAGALMTIPVTENGFIWPMVLVGGTLVENNMSQLNAYDSDTVAALNLNGDGIDLANTILSFKTYARWKFTEQLWVLGAYTYTDEFGGKSWDDDILDGGMQMPPEQIEVALGYQFTPKNNIRLDYAHFPSDDDLNKVWLNFNHVF